MSNIHSKDSAYCVAWSRLPGVLARQLHGLAARFGSWEAAWRAPAAAVLPLLGRKTGEEALALRGSLDPQAVWLAVQRPGQQVLVAGEPGFPAPLAGIPDPPALLYVRGRLPGWERGVAIVGTRRASAYGLRVARKLGRDLAAPGAVVISGAAAGIDAQAHAGALGVPGGLTVAVLGCGLDHVYPAAHGRLYEAIAAQGALVTEHAPDESPTRYSFPRRNRLIAGLSHGVIVVEASERSGSLITVDFALEQGRAVLAVPGPIDGAGSAGPHALLRDGARLVTQAQDVLDELGWELALPTPTAPLEPTEARVLAALAQGPRGLDPLVAACGGTSGLAAALLRLELAGRIVRLAGARYALS